MACLPWGFCSFWFFLRTFPVACCLTSGLCYDVPYTCPGLTALSEVAPFSPCLPITVLFCALPFAYLSLAIICLSPLEYKVHDSRAEELCFSVIELAPVPRMAHSWSQYIPIEWKKERGGGRERQKERKYVPILPFSDLPLFVYSLLYTQKRSCYPFVSCVPSFSLHVSCPSVLIIPDLDLSLSTWCIKLFVLPSVTPFSTNYPKLPCWIRHNAGSIVKLLSKYLTH